MEQYTDFSSVYDMFMDNVPYDKWAEGIVKVLKEHGIDSGLVLDLGCGTGTLTRLLAELGYDMIGVDSSEDMLAEAMEKSGMVEALEDETSGSDILYLCQDITEFELYGTVRAVISTCDSLNYLTEYEDLVKTFKLVNNYIEMDGLFLFDMNAPEKYEQTLSSNVFAENREDASFIWENTYDEESHINEYALTLFLRDDESDMYEKIEEYHYQRAYSREEIKDALTEAGLEIVSNTEADQRMYYVVKVIEGKKLGNVG